MEKVLKYHAIVKPLDASNGGSYLAELPDLPGCMADGETAREALANVENAAAEWIAAAKKMGREIPEPTDRGDYSGKWAVGEAFS